MHQNALETCRHSFLLTSHNCSIHIVKFYHVIWHYGKQMTAKPSLQAFIVFLFYLTWCYIMHAKVITEWLQDDDGFALQAKVHSGIFMVLYYCTSILLGHARAIKQ